MARKPTYEELRQRVKESEKEVLERKQAEDTLRENEEKWRSLVENAPGFIINVNRDGKIQFINRGVPGISVKDAIGTSVYEYIETEYQNTARKTINQVFKTGEPGIYEVKGIGPDGHHISWYETQVGPIKHDSQVVAVTLISTDITEHKQAEETIRNSEEKYRSLVESTEDSIYLVDRDCRYLFMNQKHLSRFDLPPDKVIGRAYGEFHSKKETKEFAKKVKEVFECGKSLSYEYRSERDGGYYIRTLSPVNGPDGTMTAVTIDSKDITERKRADEALRESEERYRTILESIEEGYYEVDIAGNFTFFNNSLCGILGYSEDELMGMNNRQYTDKETAKELYQAFNKVYTRGRPARGFDWEVMRKDGTKRHVETSISLMKDKEGRPVGFRGIVRDITEHKRAEEELQRSREELRNLADHLQSVREQERTTIAREIHDDMGQTLTALKMDISWLSKKLPKDQETLLEKTKAMTKLTDMTIKTVKRISTELRPGLLDDLGLVAAIEWQAEEFQNRTGIRCELAVDPEEIILDRDRSTAIFRIFQETLTNIARHAKATRVTASLKEKDDKLELRVRDNGSGITKEQISDSKSFGLMGIRERVHPWEGQVKISGKPGEGTTVVVRMPIGK